jgi:hypothetical protein
MFGFKEAFAADLRSRVSVLFWLLLTLFVVFAGPFGSYESMGLTQRVLIGLPSVFVIMLAGTLVRLLVSILMMPCAPRLAAIVTALAASAVLTPLILELLALIAGHVAIMQPHPVELAVLVLSLSLAHSALRYQAGQEVRATSVQASVAAHRPEHRILQRIEPEQRGAILAMSVRDHYVDVQTDKATVSLLLRFGDAMAEVAPQAGVQVHRSHWVAWAAIGGVEREGSKLYLRLTDHTRVPVSKNHRAKLDARGLL